MGVSIETDNLFVISDTHLGGLDGGQIFASTFELKGLLKRLASDATKSPDEIVTLLINGDFVDFLAEPQSVYFDPLGACGRLDRILLHEPNFVGILKGLQTFLGQPNCRMIINLGNHDLELALPWVKEHFIGMVCDEAPEARSRIQVLTDGTGCRVRINGFQVYCTHGNEFDAWNVTDHEQIRRIARSHLRGETLSPWIPNAGTQMVIEIMNDIKRDYPFVDILKPETEAVIPILSALRPTLAAKLANMGGILRRRILDDVRQRSGFLSGEEGPVLDNAPYIPRSAPSRSLAEIEDTQRNSADRLLKEANEQYMKRVRPADLILSEQMSDQLGATSRIKAWASGRTLPEQMRRELQSLAQDRSFDLTTNDALFNDVDEHVGSGIDVVVTGHSHLRRAHARRFAPGYYYNTGTWARVVQITGALLNDPERFGVFFQAIEAGTLDALDGLENVIERFNPVFAARTEGTKVRLSLETVQRRGNHVTVTTVGGTEFELG